MGKPLDFRMDLINKFVVFLQGSMELPNYHGKLRFWMGWGLVGQYGVQSWLYRYVA